MEVSKSYVPVTSHSNFCLIIAATTTFLPYITLHMIQIGITIEEVAIIYAILPFASCVGPPIAGKSLVLTILLALT
jgi:MFS_1 like family